MLGDGEAVTIGDDGEFGGFLTAIDELIGVELHV